MLKVDFHEPLSLRLFDTAGKNLGAYDFRGGYQEFYLPNNNGMFLLQVTDGKNYRTEKFF